MLAMPKFTLVQSFRALLTFALLSGAANAVLAQAQPVQVVPNGVVYRCVDNYYTDNAKEAKERNCKAVTEATITVIAATRAPVPAQRSTRDAVSGGAGAPRVEGQVQRERDSDRRRILGDELSASETKLAELRKEFNNGEPDKRGDEARNYQKYLDRVQQMRADISRAEADSTALKREISNLRE
jgi:hypothetical protein